VGRQLRLPSLSGCKGREPAAPGLDGANVDALPLVSSVLPQPALLIVHRFLLGPEAALDIRGRTYTAVGTSSGASAANMGGGDTASSGTGATLMRAVRAGKHPALLSVRSRPAPPVPDARSGADVLFSKAFTPATLDDVRAFLDRQKELVAAERAADANCTALLLTSASQRALEDSGDGHIHVHRAPALSRPRQHRERRAHRRVRVGYGRVHLMRRRARRIAATFAPRLAPAAVRLVDGLACAPVRPRTAWRNHHVYIISYLMSFCVRIYQYILLRSAKRPV
jgi:hypothetical protein